MFGWSSVFLFELTFDSIALFCHYLCDSTTRVNVIDWVLISDLCQGDLGIGFFLDRPATRNTNPVLIPRFWQFPNLYFLLRNCNKQIKMYLFIYYYWLLGISLGLIQSKAFTVFRNPLLRAFTWFLDVGVFPCIYLITPKYGYKLQTGGSIRPKF